MGTFHRGTVAGEGERLGYKDIRFKIDFDVLLTGQARNAIIGAVSELRYVKDFVLSPNKKQASLVLHGDVRLKGSALIYSLCVETIDIMSEYGCFTGRPALPDPLFA